MVLFQGVLLTNTFCYLVVRCYTTLSLPWGWKELYRFIDLYIYISRPVGENSCLIGRDAMEKRRGLVGGA